MLYLIAKGASLNAQNKDGDTPLHLAIKRYSQNGYDPKVPKILLWKGASRELRNKEGKNAIEMTPSSERYSELR